MEKQLVHFKTEEEKDQYFLEVIEELKKYYDSLQDPFSYFLGGDTGYFVDPTRKYRGDNDIQFYEDYEVAFDRELDYNFMVTNKIFPRNEEILHIVLNDLDNTYRQAKDKLWQDYSKDLMTLGFVSVEEISIEKLDEIAISNKKINVAKLIDSLRKNILSSFRKLEEDRSVVLSVDLDNYCLPTDEFIFCRVRAYVDQHSEYEPLHTFFEDTYSLSVKESAKDILEPIKPIVEKLLKIF